MVEALMLLAATLLTPQRHADVHLSFAFRCARPCAGDVVLRATRAAGRVEGLRVPIAGAAGVWHRIELTLDDGVLTGWLDERRLDLARHDLAGLAPTGLILVDATAAIEIRDMRVAAPDARTRSAPRVGAGFEEHRLDPFFYAETVAVADIDRDGHRDIVAGPRYFLGPDFVRSRAIYAGGTTDPDGFSTAPLSFAADVTGDGWPDMLIVRGGTPGGKPLQLFVNPAGALGPWRRFVIFPDVQHESIAMADLDGDGRAEIALRYRDRIGYIRGDPARPTAPWTFHPVSDAGDWGPHAIGVGDVDGDGRPDILQARGWWRQSGAGWHFHRIAFGEGADILVTDVDGDGDADVIAADDAHGWGISWFRQTRANGAIAFARTAIMAYPTGDGAVAFSQPHALALADMDGDGVQDVVSGKRWWAHGDGFGDADAQGAPVLYWFGAKRAAAGVTFTPHLVSNVAGIGNQVVATDVDGDGRTDIVTSARHGTFLFRGIGR